MADDKVDIKVSELATKAAKNNKDLYESGKLVEGAYDVYILTKAKVNVTSWVYDKKSLEDNIINLSSNTTYADKAKKIAHEYLAMKGLKATEDEKKLFDLLKKKQKENGSFDNDVYSDMPAFEGLGRAGSIDKINTKTAIEYILSQQDNTTGTWGYGDFQTTAQAVRTLIYLKDYAGNQESKVEEAINKGIDWIKTKQQDDGSFTVSSVWNGITYWDDKVIDTSEVIYIL